MSLPGTTQAWSGIHLSVVPFWPQWRRSPGLLLLIGLPRSRWWCMATRLRCDMPGNLGKVLIVAVLMLSPIVKQFWKLAQLLPKFWTNVEWRVFLTHGVELTEQNLTMFDWCFAQWRYCRRPTCTVWLILSDDCNNIWECGALPRTRQVGLAIGELAYRLWVTEECA